MRADGFLAEAISLHQQGKHAEAEASYRAVLRTHPGNFTALHHLGVLALGQNKLDEARDLITRALAIDGSSSEAHNNIGNVLRAQGKPGEAILAYNRATRINPSNAGALSNLAIALMDQNKYAEAITALEKAVELDPRFCGSALQSWKRLRRLAKARKGGRGISSGDPFGALSLPALCQPGKPAFRVGTFDRSG